MGQRRWAHRERDAGGQEMEEWAAPSTVAQDVHHMPASFACVIFTAGAHPLVPSVMHSTRSRREYRAALCRSWSIFSIFAILTGGLAFYMPHTSH